MYIVKEVGKKSVPWFDFQAVVVQYFAVLSCFCHIIFPSLLIF